ncbi:MAG: class I SAM-dependent methyltransferase [Planctomycetota bacterium]
MREVIPTLYEDERLIAIDKPTGVGAGGGPRRSTEGLAEILAAARGQGETFEVANRLSRHESGVLLLGKDREIVQHIRSALRAGRVTQNYVAVVLGNVTKAHLSIDPRHGSSRGRRPAAGSREKLRRGAGDRAAKRGVADSGKRTPSSPTDIRLLRSSGGRSLVRLRTTVATTHALRAQMRAVGLRLLDDRLHDPSRHRRPTDALCLHLERVSFHHPHLRSKHTVACRPPQGFSATLDGKRDTERALRAALVRRLPLLMESSTDSYRLLTGGAEGLQGLVAEKYGPIVVLQVREAGLERASSLMEVARWYRRTLGSEAVYVKRFPKTHSDTDGAAEQELRTPRPLLGKTMPEQVEIIERGLRFMVKPYDGASVGLYLDHRENRRRVRSLAGGRDVLNLFAYTCGFSVAAAAGEAASVTSVDLSGKNLEWGRANFALNGLDETSHEFRTADAIDYLKRAQRQERSFDLIILDPPTFAHARRRKRSFSILRDLPDLISQAAALLRPAGVMMISTNHRRITMADLQEQLKAGAGRRRYEVTATPPLPSDFSMDPEHAKTIFVRFD